LVGKYAPLATAATRAPYAIYLKYRLGKKQNQGRTKSSRRHLIARNWIHYKNFTMNDYMNKITTGILPRSWSLLWSSDVVFHARFPRRLGRPKTTSTTLLSEMVSLKLLCSSAADDELIDAWLLVRGLQIAREVSRSKGGRLGPEMVWASRPGPISAQFAASFAWCCFPSLLDPSPSACGPLSSVSLRVGRSSLSRKIRHFSG
jgi:hypothetical protein